MSNLKLITTEKFGDLDCNFYRNMNDDILLTREQIGSALKYTNPMVAIGKIHKRHSDRLTQYSFTTLVNGHGTYFYNERGIMEICRWSNSKNANEFMDWVWTIVEKYRNREINNNSINMQPLIDTITTLSQSIATIQQDISVLKESQQSIQKQLPKKKFSAWTSKMFPKYQLLMDYFDIGRKELYHNLYIELQNTYPDIDLSQEQDDYCFENGLDSCFTLDVIEHNRNLRMLFTSVVDNLLAKYNLAAQSEPVRRTTIFDQ